jgi:hypothetical protein
MAKRIRTVEYEPGWGWIARHPKSGEEVWPDFRWASRSVARAVVNQALLSAPNIHEQNGNTNGQG